MPPPTVSVLLPVRNGGKLLGRAVESLLRQTLDDFELIVVDDGSSDAAIADLPSDRRLQVLRNPGRGIVGALNAAAAIARAPYLARMDADDIALPKRLQTQVGLLESTPSLGIVGARVEVFSDHGTLGGGYRRYQDWINSLIEPDTIRREIFVESPIPHPTAVLRRDIFERLGGYRDTVWAEDYDLWLRAFVHGVAMAKPEAVLLRWRDSTDRLSRRDPRYRPDAFVQAKAHYLARSVLPNRQTVIWGAGPTGASLYDALAKEGIAVRAFIDVDEKKIGGRKRGQPVLAATAVASLDNTTILGAVGAAGARADIRAALLAEGRVEGEDFWFTA